MTDTKPVLFLEDDGLFGRAVSRLIRNKGYTVVGPTDDPDEAIQLARDHEPYVALVDIKLEGRDQDGIDVALRLRQLGVPSIIVTGHDDEELVLRAAAAKPLAFLVKGEDVRSLLAQLRLAWERGAPMRALTPAQRRVALRVARGLSYAAVADETGLREGTVARHVQDACERLGCSGRGELVARVVG